MSDLTALWSAEAEADLDRIDAYLSQHSPNAASAFAGAVLDAVESLLGHPEAGSKVEGIIGGRSYRSLHVEPHHRLYYRVDGGQLLLARIWDTRREPEALTLTS